MIEDEMVGWHHQLNGHEFEQALRKPTRRRHHREMRAFFSCMAWRAIPRTMHGGGSAPSCCAFTHRVVFLELRRHSRVTTGISAFPLRWPWEAQSSPRVARESWGLRSSHRRAEETSPRRVSAQSSLRLTSIESVIPSSHLILCHPLLFLPKEACLSHLLRTPLPSLAKRPASRLERMLCSVTSDSRRPHGL